MVKINVSTPRTALLLLILIVGCGLILSLVRMSDMPTTAYYTSSRQYITRVLEEAAAQQHNTDPLYVEDGPTRFEDDSIVNLQKDDRGQHNLPQVSESTAEPATDQVITAEDPTEEQSTGPPATEENSGLPTSTESSSVDKIESTLDGSTEPPTQDQQGSASSEPPTQDQQGSASSEPPTQDQQGSASSEPPTQDQQGSSSAEQKTDKSSGPPTDAVQGTEESSQGSETEAGVVTTKNSSSSSSTTLPPTQHTDTAESSSDTSTKSKGPVHVLLLTEGRSGSTWLSSYFWHRPEVYYTFEPLYQTPVWKKSGCSDTEEQRKDCDINILSHFWKCDFHSSALSVLGRYPNYGLNCQKGEYRCTQPGKEAACNAATHRVAKTIRLWDLTHIRDIMADTANFDVRVIHLVRDPRPLLKSRSKGGFGSLDGMHRHGDYGDQQSFEDQCATVCNRMLETSQLGDNPPDWLKNRYVRITHEQMSLHPIETAKMLYKFVDMTWTKESEDFIYKTTIGEVGRGGMFGIGKVSTKVVNAWKMMRESVIEQITRACYKTLTYLDYETDLEKIRQWKLDNAELFSEDEIAKVNEESAVNGNEET